MTAQPIEDDDPFADALLPRDRYKRPMIVQIGGGKPVPYTRASTFANELDNGAGLTVWKARTTALGIARNPDLAALAASLRYAEPSDLPADATFEAKAAHKQALRDLRDDKSALDEIIETAQHRVDDRASHGTAVHAFTDPFASPHVPERMDADVKSYFAEIEKYGIQQVLSEKFVVCDELQVAGTFDGTYHIPGGLLVAAGYEVGDQPSDFRVVGDKKTGSIHEVAVAIQTAVYSRGQLYTPELDGSATREALGVRQDVALLIHIPKGKGETHLYLIDLRLGWVAANLAVAVRDMNARKNVIRPILTVAERETIVAALDVLDAATAPAAPVSAEKPKRKRRTKAEMAAARAAEAAADANIDDEAAGHEDAVVEPNHLVCEEGGPHGEHEWRAVYNGPHIACPGRVPEPTVTEVAGAADRIIDDIKAERREALHASLDATEAAIKARLDAERAAAPTGFVSSPERDAALANAAANLKASAADLAKVTATPPITMSNADAIATAPSVDALLALHADYGATWTDDDKALATARRNLLLGGVATTAVTA